MNTEPTNAMQIIFVSIISCPRCVRALIVELINFKNAIHLMIARPKIPLHGMATLASGVESYVSCTSPLQQRLPINYFSVAPSKRTHQRSTSRLRALKTELSDFALQSPLQALASLRLHTLTYLGDLEVHLSSVEPTLIRECLRAKKESEVEKVRLWAKISLEMLARIRSDVASQLPDIPQLLPQKIATTDATPSPTSDSQEPDVHPHLDYVPKLSEHLRSLQSHLTSVDLPHSLAESLAKMKPHTTVQELIRFSLAPKFVDPTVDHSGLSGGDDELAEAEAEIARALEKSCNGSRLIEYSDLPEAWQGNPFVTGGYRYAIPVLRTSRMC